MARMFRIDPAQQPQNAREQRELILGIGRFAGRVKGVFCSTNRDGDTSALLIGPRTFGSNGTYISPAEVCEG